MANEERLKGPNAPQPPDEVMSRPKIFSSRAATLSNRVRSPAIDLGVF
jgi:hypothetical protein